MYTINKFAKLLGVTPQTLRNWDKSGKLKPIHTSGNGYRYYSEEQLQELKGNIQEKIVVGYCRVSSNKQKDDLKRQVENMQTYLLAQGKPFKIITDIGSGINYNKKGLNLILKEVTENKIEKIVILYKDRLVRFGYELIENICSIYGTKIEIIDNIEKSEEQELVEDLIQIITVFSCKLQGKRANKTKKMIQELINDNNKES